MAEVILSVNNLSKHFSGLVAVNELDFEMGKGTIHSLIGPNGSGKTTTVNMITGVLAATFGEILYKGQRIDGMPVYQIARLGIGRTFQNLKLFGSMSVLDNLKVGGNELGNTGLIRFLVDLRAERLEEKNIHNRAEEVLAEIGLEDLRYELVSNLPYGKQKMVELARALMMKPELLILDEPAAGLNPSERQEFIDILLETHHKGVDLFLIEHNMDVVMSISDKITVLNFGSKIAEGDAVTIQNDDNVIKAYLGDSYKKSISFNEEG